VTSVLGTFVSRHLKRNYGSH